MFAFLFYVAMGCTMTYLGSFFTPYMPEYMTTGKFVTLTFYYVYMFLCACGCIHALYRAYFKK